MLSEKGLHNTPGKCRTGVECSGTGTTVGTFANPSVGKRTGFPFSTLLLAGELSTAMSSACLLPRLVGGSLDGFNLWMETWCLLNACSDDKGSRHVFSGHQNFDKLPIRSCLDVHTTVFFARFLFLINE